MTTEKPNQTSFRLSEALLKELRHACIDRGISQQEAVSEAIQIWLAGGIPKTDLLHGVSEADTPLVLAFPRFLRKAHPETAGYVRSIIRQWLTLDAAGKRARESGRQNSGT